MIKRILWIGLWAIVATSAQGDEKAETDLIEQIKNRCAAKWDIDYRMQRHCIEQQMKAGSAVQEWMTHTADKPKLVAILDRCMEKWQDEHGLDYRMVDHCYRKQAEAMRALGIE